MKLYVNTYAVGRACGGPEEGGWWFDTGVPVASVPVELTDDERETIHEIATRESAGDHNAYQVVFIEHLRRKAQTIRDEWAERYPRTNKRSSVLGGEDHEVYIEDHFARAFPEEVPHYE